MKYFNLLEKILKNGQLQNNKKGNIKYLLNEIYYIDNIEFNTLYKYYKIPKLKLENELELFLRGENNIEKYIEKDILWWNYLKPFFINSYPDYFKKLQLLINKINNERSQSKQYVCFLGNNEYSNQMPCISLIQFQINKNELTISVYQRSSDANLGLPNDIYQINLIAQKILIPLKSITFFIGNIHIYENNIELTYEMLKTNKKPIFNLNI